jgi:hypothetical protein
MARLFGLGCPFVSYLAIYWKPLPMVILGMPIMISGVLLYFFLPETAGRDLPQTMDEGLELNRTKK